MPGEKTQSEIEVTFEAIRSWHFDSEIVCNEEKLKTWCFVNLALWKEMVDIQKFVDNALNMHLTKCGYS